jgi:hypothetical protein
MSFKDLNLWVTENPIISAILLSIIGNLLTDFFKKIYHSFILKLKSSSFNLGTKVSEWSKKNIELIINYYEEEMEKVEKLSLNSKHETFELLINLYDSSIAIFIIVVVWIMWYLFLRDIHSNVILYASIAITTKLIFRWLSQVISNLNLLKKARSIKDYKERTQMKIDNYKKLL